MFARRVAPFGLRHSWILPLVLASSACIIVIDDGGEPIDEVGDFGDSPPADEITGGSSGTSDSGTSDSGTSDSGWGSSDDATATGTTDTSSTDSSSDDASDDCLFICDFDLPPEPTPCDPFAQNCPVGEKCMALGEGPGGPWFTTVCSPIIGEGLLNDPCTINAPEAVDDCAAGLFCWQGQCTSFCKGSLEDPLCAGSSSCELFDDVLPLCLNQCDPLAQDCGPDMGCWWTGIDFSCANTSLDLPTGDPCGFINDCEAGNVCLVAELFPDCAGDNCCASFCSLSDADACAGQPGLGCVSFFEMGQAPPGFEDLGVCVLG